MPSFEHANIHTLGGDTNQDATYHALHIRRGDPPSHPYISSSIPLVTPLYINLPRSLPSLSVSLAYHDTNEQLQLQLHYLPGDFQYKDTRLTAEEIWLNIRHLLDTNVTRLLYIATDEKDKNFFRPFQQEFEVGRPGVERMVFDHWGLKIDVSCKCLLACLRVCSHACLFACSLACLFACLFAGLRAYSLPLFLIVTLVLVRVLNLVLVLVVSLLVIRFVFSRTTWRKHI